MANKPVFTLSAEQERQVREALRRLIDAEAICSQGAAAGFDMTAQESACAYYRERLSKIIEVMTTRSRE